MNKISKLTYQKNGRRSSVCYKAKIKGSFGTVIDVIITDSRPKVGGFHGGAQLVVYGHGFCISPHLICQHNGVSSIREIKRLLLEDINNFLNQTWEQES